MPDTSPKRHAIEAEIFSAGTWNGETFTRGDLEEIARNFALLRNVLHPPLKFGHDAGQTLIGQDDGDPALGWVEALRVEGDKLIARFVEIPGVVRDAIDEGLYRHVSAELYFDVRHEGRALGKALKAVALLGADLPAVTNLEALSAYLPEPAGSAQGRFAAEGGVRRFTLSVREGAIDLDAPGATLPPALERELSELREFKAREESRRRDAEAEARRTRALETQRDAAEFSRRAVEEGRMPPYLRERLLRELEARPDAGSTAERPVLSLDWVKAFVSSVPATLPLGEVAFSAESAGAATDDEDPSRTLARMASAKMVELNLGYGKAADYVLNTNPGLARAYRAYILKANLGG